MIVCFDDDFHGADVVQELRDLPEGEIWFKKHIVEGSPWYFFSDFPITIAIIEKTLNINQPNCKHLWQDANNKCEDCGHQG